MVGSFLEGVRIWRLQICATFVPKGIGSLGSQRLRTSGENDGRRPGKARPIDNGPSVVYRPPRRSGTPDRQLPTEPLVKVAAFETVTALTEWRLALLIIEPNADGLESLEIVSKLHRHDETAPIIAASPGHEARGG
jgi:hypothetical protein